MAEKGRAARGKPAGRPSVKRGYEKIAFGGVNDAVRLLFEEEPDPRELERLDLNSVAEIRRVRDGLEIKFYDQMKALECLRSLEESDGKQPPLYRALMACARAAGKEGPDGD